MEPIAQTIEAYELIGDDYDLVASGDGASIFHAPPFTDPAINLALLWD